MIELKYRVQQSALLFISMVNDLLSYFNTQSVLYADDTTFFNSCSEFESLQNVTKNTLTQTSIWFRANGFLLNDNKTQYKFFNLRDSPVEMSTDCVKFLGLQIDNKISWEHIKCISTRLSRVIYLLRNRNHYVPFNFVRAVYFAFLQSIISYESCFGGMMVMYMNLLLLKIWFS